MEVATLSKRSSIWNAWNVTPVGLPHTRHTPDLTRTRRGQPVMQRCRQPCRRGVAESFSVLQCDEWAASGNLPGTSLEFCPGTESLAATPPIVGKQSSDLPGTPRADHATKGVQHGSLYRRLRRQQGVSLAAASLPCARRSRQRRPTSSRSRSMMVRSCSSRSSAPWSWCQRSEPTSAKARGSQAARPASRSRPPVASSSTVVPGELG